MRALLLLLLVVGACARDKTASASKGVEVVDNQNVTWTAQTAWKVDSTPFVSIGRVDGPPEYQLFRANDALRLSDGTIVIANAGTGQLRFFDSAGANVRTVGGAGEGPGEYSNLRSLERYGADSLLTWDTQLSRGTVLTRDGTYARTITPPRAFRFSYPIGVFADGSLLGLRFGLVMPVQHAAFRYSQDARVKPQDVLAFRLSSSGSADSIGKFFLTEMFVSPALTTELPFGRVGAFATAGEHFYYGSGAAFEIRMYTPQGNLVRIVRAARPNAPLTRSMIDAYAAEGRARARDASARQNVERLVSEAPFPSTIPAFSDLIVDAADNLWVGAFHLRDQTATRWTVFDSSGHLLGELDLPAGLSVYEIGRDYVLGRLRDELDVERIVLHRLRKPASLVIDRAPLPAQVMLVRSAVHRLDHRSGAVRQLSMRNP